MTRPGIATGFGERSQRLVVKTDGRRLLCIGDNHVDERPAVTDLDDDAGGSVINGMEYRVVDADDLGIG